MTVSNFETVTGGAGNDLVTVGVSAAGDLYALGAGDDKLILGNTANDISITGVESVVGGTAGDLIRLDAAATVTMANVETVAGTTGEDKIVITGVATALDIDPRHRHERHGRLLGRCSDRDLTNVDVIVGGASTQVITLGGSIDGSIDLAGGKDSLTLAAGGNTLTASNIETINGGSGADLIKIVTALTSGAIDGKAGTTLSTSPRLARPSP